MDQSVSYNKPASITQGIHTISFLNDLEYQRFKQMTPEGATPYIAAYPMRPCNRRPRHSRRSRSHCPDAVRTSCMIDAISPLRHRRHEADVVGAGAGQDLAAI